MFYGYVLLTLKFSKETVRRHSDMTAEDLEGLKSTYQGYYIKAQHIFKKPKKVPWGNNSPQGWRTFKGHEEFLKAMIDENEKIKEYQEKYDILFQAFCYNATFIKRIITGQKFIEWRTNKSHLEESDELKFISLWRGVKERKKKMKLKIKASYQAPKASAKKENRNRVNQPKQVKTHVEKFRKDAEKYLIEEEIIDATTDPIYKHCFNYIKSFGIKWNEFTTGREIPGGYKRFKKGDRLYNKRRKVFQTLKEEYERKHPQLFQTS